MALLWLCKSRCIASTGRPTARPACWSARRGSAQVRASLAGVSSYVFSKCVGESSTSESYAQQLLAQLRCRMKEKRLELSDTDAKSDSIRHTKVHSAPVVLAMTRASTVVMQQCMPDSKSPRAVSDVQQGTLLKSFAESAAKQVYCCIRAS